MSTITVNWELLTIITGGIATLAMFSFLYKENKFYRFFEHIFIGIAAGYGPVYIIRDNLWPRVLEPMFGLNILHFPDGTTSAEYESWRLIYILPLLFGLLYYFIYSIDKKLFTLKRKVCSFFFYLFLRFRFKKTAKAEKHCKIY